ncbi:polysaccharide deacetylase family protein [Salinicoccus luteus]|uniref:polysaccharide deacetylase family protein n=1 Tax=Salinicoccus luteus TaxID=367840 RepID=UPI0004E0BA14|nr:hypothetical protein [Salinicoccus luteus]
MKNGTFIISLDFELYWGYLAITDYNKEFERFYQVRDLASKMIRVFDENEIKVSWSTVGFLMLDDSKRLNALIPHIDKPEYKRRELDNYFNFTHVIEEDNFREGVFFASELVEELKNSKYQTIGTHSFSHYYCLEDGQTVREFADDLRMAKEIADEKGIEMRSIVFPRNQFDRDYLNLLKEYGIDIYRGTPDHLIFRPRRHDNYFIRGMRLVDTYLNITGNQTHDHPSPYEELFDIKASRFLKPQNGTPRVLRSLQLRRIKNEMTAAAKNNHYYHLWWHPHNFSVSPEENFRFLDEIIDHFKVLERKYGFSSESMESYVEKVRA